MASLIGINIHVIELHLSQLATGKEIINDDL